MDTLFRFIDKYMPRLGSWLHYRTVDVSTIKELCKRWYPQITSQAPKKDGGHRAHRASGSQPSKESGPQTQCTSGPQHSKDGGHGTHSTSRPST